RRAYCLLFTMKPLVVSTFLHCLITPLLRQKSICCYWNCSICVCHLALSEKCGLKSVAMKNSKGFVNVRIKPFAHSAVNRPANSRQAGAVRLSLPISSGRNFHCG